MSFKVVSTLIFLILSLEARAKLEIPRGLTSSDRRQVVDRIGVNSGPLMASNPYPLGGYSGIEMSISQQSLQTEEIGNLGQTSARQNQTQYWLLSFAKGLYHNVDLFLNFSPLGQDEQVTMAGGGLRWCFFERLGIPFTLGTQVGVASLNFQNQINLTTQSADFVMTFPRDDYSFYLGIGQIRASAKFLGGPQGVTDSGLAESESRFTVRTFLGGTWQFQNWFVGAEASRAAGFSSAWRLGLRF